MRLVCLVSFIPFALLAACGGGGGPQLVDAAPIDSEVITPDAELCQGQTFCEADSVCADLTSDEGHCGDCTTACSGGQFCNASHCECPAPFVPADPVLGFSQESDQGPLRLEIGAYQDPNSSVLDVLVVGIDVAGTITAGPTYDLSGDAPGTPPFMAAAYNVNPQTQQADAAVYATAGTITFTSICASGVAGHADNVHFSAVDSISNPQIIPDGCSFDVASVTFSYGTPCT